MRPQKAFHGLEVYYSGINRWTVQTSFAKTEWRHCPIQREVTKNCKGHLDVAMVVWHAFGHSHASWMKSPNYFLGGITPESCLETAWGQRRLKEALIRYTER